MSLLFEPYCLGHLTIRNRFIRSATTSYWSYENGNIRPQIVSLYNKLAEGGTGLLVKGHLYVSDAGKAHSGMAGISKEHHLSGLKKLTDAVHKHECSIVAQPRWYSQYSR
jgi:2,4-dienoyl-CoA reductase-like NADH-dependent reductase (Old Yellow Enzyme family)